MARSHFYRVVLDSQGRLVTNGTVFVLQPGSESKIPDILYTSESGSGFRGNPFAANGGAIDFYLDDAQPVRIKVERPELDPIYIEDLDVGSLLDVKQAVESLHSETLEARDEAVATVPIQIDEDGVFYIKMAAGPVGLDDDGTPYLTF